jgi:hypothetical protein
MNNQELVSKLLKMSDYDLLNTLSLLGIQYSVTIDEVVPDYMFDDWEECSEDETFYIDRTKTFIESNKITWCHFEGHIIFIRSHFIAKDKYPELCFKDDYVDKTELSETLDVNDKWATSDELKKYMKLLRTELPKVLN